MNGFKCHFFSGSLTGGWVNICAWSDNEGVLGESCASTQVDGCAYLVPPVGEGLVLVFPLSVNALLLPCQVHLQNVILLSL